MQQAKNADILVLATLKLNFLIVVCMVMFWICEEISVDNTVMF